MGSLPLFYWQEKMGKTQPHEVSFALSITGAGTNSQLPQGQPILTTYAAIAAQSTIDNFLGTTNEFLIADFDATAMGANALGLIVNMGGQAGTALYAKAQILTGTGGITVAEQNVAAVSNPADSTLDTAYWKGANGNLAMRMVLTGLDAATSGLIVVKLQWISK